MSLRLAVSARTDVGRVRPGNEDSFLVSDDARLVAVADGMGGHQADEVASAAAIAALQDGMARGASIDDAVTGANESVFSMAAADVALRGMGTTLTAGVLDGDALVIGHVGDSRAYLLRDGALQQLTSDHSVVAELVAAGELTEEQALVDPRRAMITRTIGIDATVEVDLLEVALRPGDRLLLCSDGLTTMVADDAIAEILASEDDRDRAADELVTAANLAGGTDNITVVIADVLTAGDDDIDDTADVAGTDVDAISLDDPELFEDTAETPVIADDEPGAEPATDDETIEVDPELEELRAAVEDTASADAPAPRRRWWRRSRS